jgi:ParB family chromosome partitioning protein
MEEKTDKIYYIPVDDILPNRFQPRLAFDEKELNNLADSILKYGVIQPIVLRKISDKYEIIAGERRYKAACLAGLKSIPAVINNTDDNTSAEIALLENLQRKNLTVIEEAQSYKKLIDKGFTQEDIANKLSVSQSSIANKLRLLNLPKEVRDALLYNKISERHARTLLSLNNPDLQISILNRIIDERLTVKQTEEEVSMIIMKNNFSKESQELPEEIKRFLNPASQKSENQVIESSNINKKEEVDEVVDFLSSKNVSDSIISEPNKDKLPNEPKKLDLKQDDNSQEAKEQIQDINNSIFKETISNTEKISPFQIDEEKIKPKLEIEENIQDITSSEITYNYQESVSKVKEILNNANNIEGVSIREIELNNKYQIVIEIDKSINN